VNIVELETKTLDELRDIAREKDVSGYSRLKKDDLILKLLKAHAEEQGFIFGGGVLDIIQDGIGFLRSDHLLPGSDDVYVSQSQIRRFGLRTGDMVIGQVRPPKESEKYFGLLRVEAVNGLDPEVAKKRPVFERLTPIFPEEIMRLETNRSLVTTRLIDILAPIGRGQRGLIVSPPKAGKTTVLKQIANGITSNYREIHLMVALIGERPEEVTDMDRSVSAEVISSTFDDPVQQHTRVAEMGLERAKRLVEGGRDVVILLDSITRLTRAYNLVVPPSGRTLSGGIDPAALYPPKRFFGAARNMIYEEFKGTGNMELALSRKLAERRIFPAFDIERSGTRREELLLGDTTLARVWTLRRMSQALGGGSEALEVILERLPKTATNEEFLATLHQQVI